MRILLKRHIQTIIYTFPYVELGMHIMFLDFILLLIFERELALLVALQGESSWKGWGGWGDIHWKDATSRWTEGRSWG